MSKVIDVTLLVDTHDGAYAVGYMVAQSLAGAIYECMLMQPFTDDRVKSVTVRSVTPAHGYDAIDYPSKMDIFKANGEIVIPDYL